MSEPRPNHDALFRLTFGRRENALGLVRHWLPASVAVSLDWETLNLENPSFIEAPLSALFSDLLFRVEFAERQAESSPFLIYVLIEHQSSPDRRIVWRMQRYISAIQHGYLKETPNAELPIVFPLLISNARRPWPHPLDLHSVYNPLEQLPELRPHVAQLEVVLDDLPSTTPSELVARDLTDMAVAALCLLRDARGLAALQASMAHWLPSLRSVSKRQHDDFKALFAYLLQATPPVQHHQLCATIIQEAPDMHPPIISAYDELIAEGWVQGEAVGEARGQAKGKAELLLKLLRLKFTPLPQGIEERLQRATPQQLDQIAERLLSAQTLEEVFSQE
ncbi:MAG: Rpn family recombination-promoting nuclease/putative transposase [Polyangiaceae bacterium]|nr:Rpn family recombination-promoting nuclease/putative transposase [Polyangiaceae bacterium]